MRRDDVDAFRDREAGRVGVDDEGADAAPAGRLAGAREHDVEVGDAAVRDPRLLAVDHVGVAVARAVVSWHATSEPASGSESAKAAIAAPETGGR